MTETTETSPEAFDIDAWLQDAHLPEDSCDIYKRPDVIAELAQVKARIDVEEAAQTGKTLGGSAELRKLHKRYDELLQTFGDSRTTIYVRSLNNSKLRELREVNKKAEEKNGWTKAQANTESNFDTISAAIFAIEGADGTRNEVSLTTAQVKALEDRIGSSQVQIIKNAWQRAQMQAPEVTVDFLSQPSGTSKDDTGA